MPPFRLHPDAMPPAELTALREALLASPLVARSTLAGSFRGSRGFAITFTREGRAELEARFPFLLHYLALAIDSRPERELASFWRRPRPANAFYLNLLLLSAGGSVGRHLDGTLREPSGVADAVPGVVSVLYLQVPADLEGGELLLYRGRARVGAIKPREGLLLNFRGDLDHEVAAVTTSSSFRASLVCEQYALPDSALSRLSPLHVQSKAGFAAYLADHAARTAQ